MWLVVKKLDNTVLEPPIKYQGYMVNDLRLKMRAVRGTGKYERILMLTVRISVVSKCTMKVAMSLPVPASHWSFSDFPFT